MFIIHFTWLHFSAFSPRLSHTALLLQTNDDKVPSGRQSAGSKIRQNIKSNKVVIQIIVYHINYILLCCNKVI